MFVDEIFVEIDVDDEMANFSKEVSIELFSIFLVYSLFY
jgi:hypothetical protein